MSAEVTLIEEDDEDHPVCRICLSSEDDGGSSLIAPCRCTGTMKYVHRDCLRTWRTQGSHAAEVCPVCNTAYRPTWGALPLRVLQRFPAVSAAFFGSALLWVCNPRLHFHLAEATWMHLVAPLPLCFRWEAWETRMTGSGFVPFVGSFLLNGVMCLTLPALADHFVLAVRSGSLASRLCELVLFTDNAQRLSFTLMLAAVRSSLHWDEGQQAMVHVQDAVHSAIHVANRLGISHRKSIEELLTAYFGGMIQLGVQRQGVLKDPALQHRCLQLSIAYPQHLFVYLRILAAQLGYRSVLQRWLPLVWHFANRDVGQAALMADLVLWGPFSGLWVGLAKLAFPDTNPSNSQVQRCFANILDALCSVRRGACAVRVFALYLT